MTASSAHPPDASLHEESAGPTLDPRLAWHTEPASWRVDPPTRRLHVRTDPETDF